MELERVEERMEIKYDEGDSVPGEGKYIIVECS